MNQYVKISFGFFFLFVSVFQSSAQTDVPDSSIYIRSVDQLAQFYFAQIGDHAQLYNGSEYIPNGQRANGFPYYGSNSMLSGSVSCKGVTYLGLNLYYDLVADELITNNYPKNALIKLPKEKVDSFSLGTHTFLHLDAPKTNGTLKEDGYYERLTVNEPGVYVRRSKRLIIPSGPEEPKYTLYNTYYVNINGQYYPVEGKKDLLNSLKDHGDLLKKFIRANKLNFKKQFEEAVISLSNYYSRLKN